MTRKSLIITGVAATVLATAWAGGSVQAQPYGPGMMGPAMVLA